MTASAQCVSDISIGRIKVSDRLQALAFSVAPDGCENFARLCRLAASAHVNLVFAGMGMDANSPSSLCCFRYEDSERLLASVVCDPELKTIGRLYPAVSIIDLFPHRHRINILGIALETLCRCRVDCLGLASSISALSFVVDYNLLKNAVTALSECFLLPDGCGVVGNFLA